jgi:hypothetical protein
VALFANKFKSKRARLHVPSTLSADLQWVTEILSISPRERPLRTQHPIDLQWWGDASTSFGVGIIIGQHWAAWKWKDGFCQGRAQGYRIRRALASARALCPFPEYCPVFHKG